MNTKDKTTMPLYKGGDATEKRRFYPTDLTYVTFYIKQIYKYHKT